MIIAGNGIYEHCDICCRLVKVNKFLFGSLHVCLSPEERMLKENARWQIEQQLSVINNPKPFMETFLEDIRLRSEMIIEQMKKEEKTDENTTHR